MQLLDAPAFDLEDLRGYAVMFVFFATWCEPCVEEMPALVHYATQYYDEGLRVVGITVREPDETVRRFRSRFRIPFPIGMDRDGMIARGLLFGGGHGEIEFPSTIMVDPNGYQYCFDRSSMDASEMRYRIERFLAVSREALRKAAAGRKTR